MGEKLLAQRLIRLLRETEGRSSRIAKTLAEWAGDHRDWLWPEVEFTEVPGDEGARDFWEALPGLAEAIDVDEPPPRALAAADRVAQLLALDPPEGAAAAHRRSARRRGIGGGGASRPPVRAGRARPA
jgi:hypothetical protein